MKTLFQHTFNLDLRIIYDIVERVLVIFVPAIYIFLQFISIWIPTINTYISDKGYLLLISQSLIFLFIRIDFKNTDSPKIIRSDRIVRDIENLLDAKSEYQDIKIFASTGYHYVRAFKESGKKVHYLKVLLRKHDDISTINLPCESNEDKLHFQQSANELVVELNQLVQKGQIENLDLAFYDFDTTVHFMLIENRVLFWGLTYPERQYPGSNVLASYIIDRKSESGECMIADFDKKFDYTYAFSQQ